MKSSLKSSTTQNETTAPSQSSISNILGTSLQNSDEFSQAPVTLQLKKKNKAATDDIQKGFKLFNHLKFNRDISIIDKLSLDNSIIHPAFIKLGLQCANGTISGSNSRCLAFLNALRSFINDYKQPKDFTELSKDLESKLKPNINFLTQCRPLSVSMGNAIKEFKQRILHLSMNTNEQEAKKILNEEIDSFANEKIILPHQNICDYMLGHEDMIIFGTSYAKSKLANDDCILIYGYSSLVVKVLKAAHKKNPNMKVIIVDSRPKFTGKTALIELSKIGVDCTYILINAVSFVMKSVSKVIFGAHALLANGYVMGSVGTSQIALIAKSFNVPVIVCCETYKFCDKVQTDVFVNNELGNPKDLLKQSSKHCTVKSPLSNWTPDSNINIINLVYDVTTPEFISCVCTEMGILPCTSVPVVLRVKNRENYQTSLSTNQKATKVE